MKFYNTIIILFLCSLGCLFGQQSNSSEQEIISYNGKYKIENQIYSFKELQKKYKHQPNFSTLAKKSRSLNTIGTISGVISAGLLVLGVSSGNNCTDFGCIVPVVILVSSIPFGLLGIILKITSTNRKKQSINSLNYSLKKEAEQDNSQIQIRPSKTGLGLTIVF